ncbi:kelch-like protein 3 [Paramacrobiotus metropolitanus]|uniref:kelch-like protein 3 n=1 Tax=Paramacrobiotus metropolitanus TaxID=2943436 RepID=UPI00244601A5|nr:kelch-like protein 3 [Paramacrobiotus metropolitanus]
MKAKGALCDVVMKGAEDLSDGIPCHRNVLSAHSSYFLTMFTSGLKESSESSVQLHNISTSTLKALIDYAYTLEIKIDADNVQSILLAALFLDIVPVANLCWDFVEKHMDVSSSLMIHCLADRHSNARVAAKAKAMVLSYFLQISRSADFLLIDTQKLTELIASDDLRVDKEDNVLEAVLRWLDYDTTVRKAQLSDVLQFVRVGFLGPTSLEQYFLVLLNSVNSAPAPDLPSGVNRLWKAIVCADLPDNIVAPGLALLEDGSILACGGFSGASASEDRVWRYDTAKSTWTQVESMNHHRYELSAATLNGHVYAVGGIASDRRVLSSMELYDAQRDDWDLMASLPHARTAFAMVAFENRLFVFGGTNSRQHIVQTSYCYDSITYKWSQMADMPTPRSRCTTCVGTSGLIYVIENTIELRDSAVSVCLDGKIFVIGGTTKSIEYYNEDTDTWTLHKCVLPEAKYLTGCVVMSMKPSASLADGVDK